MLRVLIAVSLLLMSLDAGASCYFHAERNTTFCTQAAECPASVPAWNATTQECRVPLPPPPMNCTGTDAGTYTPRVTWVNPDNDVNASPMRAHWTRIGPIVAVQGKVLYTSFAEAPVQFEMDLPVASEFVGMDDLNGVVTSLYEARGGQVWNLVGGREANIYYISNRHNEVLHYSYSYRIKGC